MDALQAIAQDLAAPIKSFRIFAIEQVIREGGSPEVLRLLEAQLAHEDDDECRILLEHAIVAVTQKITREKPVVPKDLSQETWLQEFAGAVPGRKLIMLSTLSRPLQKGLAPLAPDLLEKEVFAPVAAAIIKTFARTWPREKISLLTQRLLEGKTTIRLAALEALISIAPDSLEKDLPSLLTADDPRTRALAITGLFRIDREEAVAHLDALFMSPDKPQKMAAIQNAFFFPFETIKAVLFKFLAAEMDLELIERAGLLFQINPDPEVPFQLWEIAEMTSPQKAPVMKKIFDGTLHFLEKTGILGDQLRAYREKLQHWVYQRRANRLIQEAIHRFSRPAGTSNTSFESLLEKQLTQPLIRRAFAEALQGDIPTAVREKLQTILAKGGPISTQTQPPVASPGPTSAASAAVSPTSSPVSDPPPAPPQAPAAPPSASSAPVVPATPPPPSPTETFLALSLEKKRQQLDLWDAKDLPAARPVLLHFLAAKEAPANELRESLLQAAQRCAVPEYAEFAEKWLQHSEIRLVRAALEYLAEIAPERAFPYLGKLVTSPDFDLRLDALRLLKRFDPQRSLEVLQNMLKDKKSEMRDEALNAMNDFDFSLIREMLCQFLLRNFTPAALEKALRLFAGNPDAENLYWLFKLTRQLPTESHPAIERTRVQMQELLVQQRRLQNTDRAHSNAEFETRWKKEEEKARQEPKAYSVKKLRPPPVASFSEKLRGLLNEFAQTYGLAVPVVFSLVIAVILFGSYYGGESPQPTVIRKGPVVPLPMQIQGTVLEKRDRSSRILFRSSTEELYLVTGKNYDFARVKTGSVIALTVVPYRVSEEGYIMAALQQTRPAP